MLGIILCGGQSRRMGSDKGLMNPEQKSWAQSAIDKMATLNIPVKISVNPQQLPIYEELFSANNIIVDNGTLSVKGPLLGTLSSHLAFPDEDIFVLACDMPLMQSSILQSLYKVYQEQTGADAYVFTNDGEPEPLCGIYRAKGLSVILGMFKRGALAKYSMKCMLDHLEVTSIPISNEQKKYFSNINSHAELNGL